MKEKMPRFAFTKATILAIPGPARGKRTYAYDTKVRGLAVSVTPHGTKSFILYRWIRGKPERIFIGRFPDMSIEQARGIASEQNAAISRGENPQNKRRADRAELTLGAFFNEYLERHAKIHKKTWPDDESQFNRYLGSWKIKKLSHVEKADIQRLHQQIGKDCGHYAANRLLALLSALFNKAREWDLYEKPNPTHGVKKFKEASRERFLQPDEVPTYLEALMDEPNESIRDFFLICLFTGARRDNVQSMKWEDIHLDRREWRILYTKNDTPQTVPLIPEAVEVLTKRKDNSSGPFVFPGSGVTGHLVEPKGGHKRILNRAELYNLIRLTGRAKNRPTKDIDEAIAKAREDENKSLGEYRKLATKLHLDSSHAAIKDFKIHDIRRTMGSWQSAMNIGDAIIGKTLGHKSVQATRIYSRLNLDPVRKAMETATTAMLAAAGLKPAAEIVDIKSTRAKKRTGAPSRA